ncbi:MAG: HD-GYP domain-containing protein [Lachnospiraceae bacterium]|nr:HD-GYP domain-containing protein [Lachnospiraceae bacterium]
MLFLFSTMIIFLFIWAFYVIIRNIHETNEAVKAKEEVKTLSVEVMEALAHTIDAKDEYTRGHSVRVAKYSRMLAEKLGLSKEDCDNVYYMGLLHDIGKIGVPNEIINSKSKLTEEEYAVIKTHPGVGYGILDEIKSRPDLSIGARWHHERYDGKGYPDGKAGEDIPFFARIIAVADSYDAMTSNRSYRHYLTQDAVRSEIQKNEGTQFDPKIAECMIELMAEDKNFEMHE